jgi:hypothetical protein
MTVKKQDFWTPTNVLGIIIACAGLGFAGTQLYKGVTDIWAQAPAWALMLFGAYLVNSKKVTGALDVAQDLAASWRPGMADRRGDAAPASTRVGRRSPTAGRRKLDPAMQDQAEEEVFPGREHLSDLMIEPKIPVAAPTGGVSDETLFDIAVQQQTEEGQRVDR